MPSALRSSVSHPHTRPTPTGRSALQFSRIIADRKVGATPRPVLCPRTQPGLSGVLVRVIDVIPPFLLTSDHVVVILALPELTVRSQQLIRFLAGVALDAPHNLVQTP